jgi:hypothetical protein
MEEPIRKANLAEDSVEMVLKLAASAVDLTEQPTRKELEETIPAPALQQEASAVDSAVDYLDKPLLQLRMHRVRKDLRVNSDL